MVVQKNTLARLANHPVSQGTVVALAVCLAGTLLLSLISLQRLSPKHTSNRRSASCIWPGLSSAVSQAPERQDVKEYSMAWKQDFSTTW